MESGHERLHKQLLILIAVLVRHSQAVNAVDWKLSLFRNPSHQLTLSISLSVDVSFFIFGSSPHCILLMSLNYPHMYMSRWDFTSYRSTWETFLFAPLSLNLLLFSRRACSRHRLWNIDKFSFSFMWRLYTNWLPVSIHEEAMSILPSPILHLLPLLLFPILLCYLLRLRLLPPLLSLLITWWSFIIIFSLSFFLPSGTCCVFFLHVSDHPSAVCNRTSASILGELEIANRSFSRKISLLEYWGRLKEKKQVWAWGR